MADATSTAIAFFDDHFGATVTAGSRVSEPKLDECVTSENTPVTGDEEEGDVVRHPNRGHPLGIGVQAMEQRRHGESKHGDEQDSCTVARKIPIEFLDLELEASREQRDAENEQQVAEY